MLSVNDFMSASVILTSLSLAVFQPVFRNRFGTVWQPLNAIARNDDIDIFTSEDMENMPLRSRMSMQFYSNLFSCVATMGKYPRLFVPRMCSHDAGSGVFSKVFKQGKVKCGLHKRVSMEGTFDG